MRWRIGDSIKKRRVKRFYAGQRNKKGNLEIVCIKLAVCIFIIIKILWLTNPVEPIL